MYPRLASNVAIFLPKASSVLGMYHMTAIHFKMKILLKERKIIVKLSKCEAYLIFNILRSLFYNLAYCCLLCSVNWK